MVATVGWEKTVPCNINKDVENICSGLCETAFNERHRNHTSSFRHEKNRNETELSNYIWALKKDKVVPSIKWKILRIVCGKPTSNFCRLCLTEKFFTLILLGIIEFSTKGLYFLMQTPNKYLIKNVKLKVVRIKIENVQYYYLQYL